ncbi:hypothetical protein [Phyllobacterium sp. 21LDTY02-6]|uniref:hypothetical protein n=1 Tax=Phyllobacterium sp. 21LDTY02-6 TaxID=2944903 RepID=UPI003532516B
MAPPKTITSAMPDWCFSPLVPMGLVLAFLCVLLSLPLVVPIGPMYWDTYIYLDAAQRLKLGQIPAIDFHTPAGALEYYQFYWLQSLFPGGQPTLLAQWSVLISAAPLMAVVAAAIDRRDRWTAYALVLPFLIFAVCPTNSLSFHSYPGVNGFGIYNRHTSLLLYVLVSALVFLPNGLRLTIVAALAMATLFMTKITGFLAGGLIGLYAIAAGRITLRQTLIAAAVFLALIGTLELSTGLVSSYLSEIAILIALNQDSLLSRFLTVFSAKLDVIMAAGLLALYLFWAEHVRSGPKPASKTSTIDHDWLWVLVVLVAGTFLETQNTGSQEFIFLWPVLYAILRSIRISPSRDRLIIGCLVAFVAVPTVAKVVHGTLRFIAVAPTYIAAPVTELKTMGLVSTRKDIMERALFLEGHYSRAAASYRDLALNGQLPSWQLYSELDYQMFWLISADGAVKAIKQFETSNNIRLESLMNLDFVNPFPWILDRDATRNIQIGADPFRTVAGLSAMEEASVRATDGILRPLCPITHSRMRLAETYESALAGRRVVKLNECWELLLRSDIAAGP